MRCIKAPQLPREIANPSQFQVLLATAGYLTELPFGAHVERGYPTVDGTHLMLVTDREFIMARQEHQFQDFQSWAVDEFLAMCELECPDPGENDD